MRSNLADKARLLHIKECIEEIESAVKNVDELDFLNNHVLRIAVVKWLEITGEAANHISNETKLNASSIQWLDIIGLRNFVTHEYFGINYAVIWKTINTQIPELKIAVTELLKDFE